MRRRWPDDSHVRLTIRNLVVEPALPIPIGPPSDSYLGALAAKYPDFQAQVDDDMVDTLRQIKAQLFVNKPFAFKPDTSRSFRLARWLEWKRINAA